MHLLRGALVSKDITDRVVVVRRGLAKIVERFEKRVGAGVFDNELASTYVNARRQLRAPAFTGVSDSDFDLGSGAASFEFDEMGGEFFLADGLVQNSW